MQQQFFVRDKTGKLAGSKLSVKMSGSEYQLMEDGKESSNSESKLLTHSFQGRT